MGCGWIGLGVFGVVGIMFGFGVFLGWFGVILGFLDWFLRLRFGFAGFGVLLVYLGILWLSLRVLCLGVLAGFRVLGDCGCSG